MNIVFLAPPFETPWLGEGKWVTVPPSGYGGIQWSMKNLMDGLVELGCKVTLIGAPGSIKDSENIDIINIGKIEDIEKWLRQNKGNYSLIHDHSCRGVEFGRNIEWDGWKRVHSHYLVSDPGEKEYVIPVSYSHAKNIGHDKSPVIRHPVNPNNYRFSSQKHNYLLYIGRISEWKGADWAALFAEKADMKLIMAGPSWEREYFDYIMSRYKNTVEYVGEVGGQDRLDLISHANATLVFSKATPGPTGKIWSEPGSQIVSESAVCGTPVISSMNGCLKEIVPHVGITIENPELMTNEECKKIVKSLPTPKETYDECIKQWGYKKIAKEYMEIYKRIIEGGRW